MFEDWKKAWQEAVSNFQKELEDEDDQGTPTQIAAMRRDLQAARRALDRLQVELTQSQRELAEEERQEQQCRRRGELAAGIGDQETVRVATEWAERHAQRARILRQKTEVLQAELGMRSEDFAGMEAQLNQASAALGLGQAPPRAAGAAINPERAKQDADFRRLDREAREKAAEARLEELKKRMQ